ncbi:MAG: ABC-2 transporter permease [Lachnospiraceae bacterium]|nr:ABC-2 transporter permease [Lachnospiraceae bacterium]
MKGLILKDLYLLKGLGKQLGLVLGFLVLWSLMINSFSFIIIYCVVMCGSLVMSTMSYDESVSFPRFALTMPINTRMLILAKYILVLIIMLGVAGIGGLLNLLLCFLADIDSQAFERVEIAATVAVFMAVNACSLPAMFKLGAEKARYIYIFCMLLFGGVIVGGMYLCEKMGISFQEAELFLSGAGISMMLFAISAVLMIISYFVSVRIVKNKEW